MPEEMFEIVPVDPISKVEKKHEHLERELASIRNALRGKTGIVAGDDDVMKKVLELIQSSEKSAEKTQEAVDTMTQTNSELSSKLTKILDLFAKATEAMETGEEADLGPAIANLSKTFSESMRGLKASLDAIGGQNQKILEALNAIERNTKRQMVMPPRPAYRQAPMQRAPMRRAPPVAAQTAPPAAPPLPPIPGVGAPKKKQEEFVEPELPPPPFPP